MEIFIDKVLFKVDRQTPLRLAAFTVLKNLSEEGKFQAKCLCRISLLGNSWFYKLFAQ